MPNCNKGDCLFELIVSKDNFWQAYQKSLEGDGKYHPEAMAFTRNETYNLNKLKQSLIDETYEFDGYSRFRVYEPKERIVDAPHYKDKIVQQAINIVLKDVYMPSFISDSYACLNGRGTHKCADRIQHFLRKAKWQHGENAHIIKIDIESFFYSIDRDIVKTLIRKKVKCEKSLRLIFKIIDSADAIAPKGLPLGNTLSQICANIYLNPVDQYAKRKLSLKYYLRYMDDILVILPNKDEARKTLLLLKTFIKDKLNLNTNKDKTKIFPISQGVNMVGFKVHATHRLLRDDCKKKIKRKVKAMPKLIADGKLSILTAEQMFNSWRGHARHASSYNFLARLMQKNIFIYRSGKTLKISMDRLNDVGDKSDS